MHLMEAVLRNTPSETAEDMQTENNLESGPGNELELSQRTTELEDSIPQQIVPPPEENETNVDVNKDTTDKLEAENVEEAVTTNDISSASETNVDVNNDTVNTLGSDDAETVNISNAVSTADETNFDAQKDTADTLETDDAEEVAIANAISSASASYVPPAAVLNDVSPQALIASIDGPSLASYDRNASVYTARNIPVAVRSKLTVPIYVTNSGSIVDYALESKYYDVGFGIAAERNDGATTVVELSRVDSNVAPVIGRFLVLSVPCALVFTFDNEYSWFREKSISYRITITPPDLKHLVHARKVRAKIALQHLLEDKQTTEKRLEIIASKRTSLLEEIELLEREMAEKRKTLHAMTSEEEGLIQRITLRRLQEEEIEKRKQKNWVDESDDLTKSGNATSTIERYEI